jgi:hypothetical protein
MVTRESVASFIDRRVRISHGGPTYVRLADPHGILVSVSDTQMLLKDPCNASDEPRAWSLDTIVEVVLMDSPGFTPSR